MILLNYGIDKDGRSCNDQILSDLKRVKDFGAVPGKWKAVLSELVAPVLAFAPLAAWSAFIWGGIDPSMAAYAIAGLASADCIGGAICFSQIRKYFKAVDASVENIDTINERMVQFMGELAKNGVHVKNVNLQFVTQYTDKNDTQFDHLDGVKSNAAVGEQKAILALVEEGEIKGWLMAVSNYYKLYVKGNGIADSEDGSKVSNEVSLHLLEPQDLNSLPVDVLAAIDGFDPTSVEEHPCRVVGGVRRRALGR